MIEIFVTYAMSFLGTPYLWGGESRRGYDCSGFVQECLRAIGEDPRGDQTAQALWDYYRSMPLGYYTRIPKRGDLIFFGKDRESISHVSIAIDNSFMIEAGGGDSTTTNLKEAYKRGAMVRIRPINSRKDFFDSYSFL
jgi:peptidoglycan endopeptidase LytE